MHNKNYYMFAKASQTEILIFTGIPNDTQWLLKISENKYGPFS